MISLYDLLQASNGQLLGPESAQIFDDLCWDINKVQPGHLFIATDFEFGDTHPLIAEAVARGASGVLCSRVPACDTQDVSVVLVRDTLDALLAWSHDVVGKLGTKIIAVTGSIGKSIAVDAIRRVLGVEYSVHTREVDGPTALVIPAVLCQLQPSHQFAVIKVDIDQPGMMARIVQAVQPQSAVITQIGDIPSANFDSTEQVTREVSRLVEYLSPTGLAVLNYDDDIVRPLSGVTRSSVLTIGMRTFGADLMAHNVIAGGHSTSFDLRYGGARYASQQLDIIGAHNLYSIMASLVVGLAHEVSIEDGLEALRAIRPLPHRMNPLPGKNGCLLVDDTYSANPISTGALLEWLGSVKLEGGRAIFVLGDLDTAAENGAAYKQVGQLVGSVVDVFVTLGAGAAGAVHAAAMNGNPVAHMTYVSQDAISILLEKIMPTSEDVVVISGGNTSPVGQIVRALLEEESTGDEFITPPMADPLITVVGPNRLSWLELNYEALANNVWLLKQHVGDKVDLMAVVKADAYGHGAAASAQTALNNGASSIGVSSVNEAMELRSVGVTAPVLTMNYTPPRQVRDAIRNDLTLTVFDISLARTYNGIARQLGRTARVHIKVDSGMGRLGVLPNEILELCRHVNAMAYLELDGIYTHFSTADEDPGYVAQQLDIFQDVMRKLRAVMGIRFKKVHAANSAATIAHQETHLDMVRTGLAMYGLHPSDQVTLLEGFQPVMSWKSMVAQVKTLPADHPVGYGNVYVTPGPERIAVIPVGYADGLRRGPQNWGEVLIRGERALVIGRVSMEKTIVSVDHIEGVSIGDEVVLLGTQGEEQITAEEVADRWGTINYEVTSSILPRVRRR